MQTRDQRIYKVTLTGSIVNMVLLVMKFVAGILGNSAAMVADAGKGSAVCSVCSIDWA